MTAEAGPLTSDPGAIAGLSARIRDRSSDPRELVEALCARAAQVEPTIQAWCGIERDNALRQADILSREAQSGTLRGPLHGIPFAVKDVIDVAGRPTLGGSKTREGAAPAAADAAIVAAAKAAGAIYMGKTHTTAFAYFDSPPPTRNPWRATHTPGGSSSGPAASVSSGTVPFSIGTQTAGSVARPAAYCGIAAFKPTTLSLVTFGMLPLAPSFDTPGFFGYRTEDAAAVGMALMAPALRGREESAPTSRKLKIGFASDPMLSRASEAVMASFSQIETRLRAAGHDAQQARLACTLQEVTALHTTISEYEIGRMYVHLLAAPANHVSEGFRAAIGRGQCITDQAYEHARIALIHARKTFWDAQAGIDFLVFPAAPDVAPEGTKTGDPSFITPFTALAGPMMTMPVAVAASGLPLGVMLLGRPGADCDLIAHCLAVCREIELPRNPAHTFNDRQVRVQAPHAPKKREANSPP